MLRALGLPLALIAAGCGGPDPVAFENRTFYDTRAEGAGSADARVEAPYPPLDLDARAYVGVRVAGDLVRMSRPKDWSIRRATLAPGSRRVEYLSPRQFLFVVSERADSPDEPWLDIFMRYEQDARAAGAELVGMRVPTATANAQGRAYVVKRSVRAAVTPFVNTSREVLLRGESHVVLVQIVHGTESLATLGDELLRVMATMEVP